MLPFPFGVPFIQAPAYAMSPIYGIQPPPIFLPVQPPTQGALFRRFGY